MRNVRGLVRKTGGHSRSRINNSSMTTCSGTPANSGSYAFHIEKKMKSSYTPKLRDVIFFSSSGMTSGQHVGLVEYVSDGALYETCTTASGSQRGRTNAGWIFMNYVTAVS